MGERTDGMKEGIWALDENYGFVGCSSVDGQRRRRRSSI